MIRNLSAFIWLRWRTAMNRIGGGDRRDWVEQLSRIGQTILPWISALLLLPSMLAIGILSFIGGKSIAGAGIGGQLQGAMVVGVRIVLFLSLLAVLLGPMVRAGRDRDSGFTRLLLLPLRRGSLHLTEVLAGFSDFWIAILVPLLLGYPVGLFAGGRWVGGLFALIVGAIFLFCMGSISSAVSYGTGLLLRKRQRAEWISFVFMLLLVIAVMLPGARDSGGIQIGFSEDETAQAAGNANVALDMKLPRVAHALPGELYVKSAMFALDGHLGAAALRAAGVALWTLGIFQLSWFFYLRRIRNPDEEGSRGDGAAPKIDGDAPLGLSTPVWEVCRTTVRLALRTVRGKLAVFLNFPIIGLTAYLLAGQDYSFFGSNPLMQLGLIAATASVALCTLSLHTVLVNQFAVDGGGLARQWLAPLQTRTLVVGKALAGALMLLVACLLCFVAAALAAPPSSKEMWIPWLLLFPLLAGSYAQLAPIHAALSAVFPKSVDLSKMGQEGNPHIAAALLGVAATALVVCAGALSIAGAYLIGDSWLWAWICAGIWCVIGMAIGWAAMRGAIALTESRRENLLLTASGR